MKCHNCGSKDENERFCTQCGQVLREESDIPVSLNAQDPDAAWSINNSANQQRLSETEDPLHLVSQGNAGNSANSVNSGNPSNPVDSVNLQDQSGFDTNNLPPDYVYNRNDKVWIVILSIFVVAVMVLAVAGELLDI
ncbi:MAG: zinc ribbon domain-containing protein [Veillonella sp.]|uniref:zinc ribbon domain-containing protein n=1 Tax=Veillonella sp. TaxID=1926307 RepID=UPI0025DDCA95|nr:zinc ribbon domain-containing protein [Veillonella sp.]MBS4913152.1 zinc ribbon domain-containing protein [Veillonella sp.]